MKIKSTFNYIDPSSFLSVTAALIFLAVGVFAVFSVIQSIAPTQNDTDITNNSSPNGTNFNWTSFFESYGPISSIFPLLILVGGIMGSLYFIHRIAERKESSYWDGEKKKDDEEPEETEEEKEEEFTEEEKQKIDKSLRDAKEGKVKPLKTSQPIDLKTRLEQRKKELKEKQKEIEESKNKKL